MSYMVHSPGAQDTLSLSDFIQSMPNDSHMFDFGEFPDCSPGDGLDEPWIGPG